MDKNDVSKEMIDSALNNILEVAEQMRLNHLHHAAEARYKEVERLQKEQETLQKELGPDHPRMKALERARRSAEYIAKFAATTRNHAEYCLDDKRQGNNFIQRDALSDCED